MPDISYQELGAGPKENASVVFDSTVKWAKELGWTGRALKPGWELESGFARDRIIKFINKIIKGSQAQTAEAIPKDTLMICCLAKLYMEGKRSFGIPPQDGTFSVPEESLQGVDKAKFNRALVAETVYHSSTEGSSAEIPYTQEVTVDIDPKISFPGMEESEMRQVLEHMGAKGKEGDPHDPAKKLVLETSLAKVVRSIAPTFSAP